MTYLSNDRIRVFVSSRLVECEQERAVARTIIESLGHQPVMFEAAGARPYAPRSVYLRGLEQSQIYIGIYREGYGYIEKNMEISGLEDEYRFARSSGIPQLLYVLRGGTMDPRLRTLVDDFTGPDITVGYFEDPLKLGDRIREDLVALVSEYFSRGSTYGQSLPISPGMVADALVSPDKRVRREPVERALEGLFETDSVVLVTGQLGSGKTVLLSALAAERGWAFVECGERSPQEVLADVANVARGLLGLPAKAFLLATDTQAALRVAWDALQFITLVLDDVTHSETLDQVRASIQVSNTHRLVLSSRGDIPMAASVYEVPPLELDEIRAFLERNRDEPLMAGELVDIQNASKGNPLYLRYYLGGIPGEYARNIVEYESKVWGSLSASARELLCYLSWSDRPLSLEDLAHLFSGVSSSTEQVTDLLASASSLLAQSDRGYSIFHPHAQETIQKLTGRSRPRLRFYIERLSKWFFDGRDYAGAFSVLYAAGFPIAPAYLEKAGRHAVVKGDFRIAVQILQMQIDFAKESSDRTRERDLTLHLAHVQSISGRPKKAIELIDRATKMSADAEPPLDILELKASIGALGKGDRSAFNQLVGKQEEYRNAGRMWDAARLSVDLSVYYVRQNEPDKAAAEAVMAMRVFMDHGDDYGYRVARSNYLSAISAFPEKAEERDRLIREIDAESKEEPRQRALLCNVQARRAREKGDIKAAKAFARQAVEIGREIGDEGIVCNNLMNLGNSYRQEANWEAAIAQYEAADKLAGQANLKMAEAAAQELLASVFNGKGDAERAVHHANYAVSISRGVSKRIESNATEELAQAYESLSRTEDARRAWLKHASMEIERTDDNEAGSYGLFRAVSLMGDREDIETYIASYSELFGVSSSKDGDLTFGERLVEDLLDLFQKVSPHWTFENAVNHGRFMFRGSPEVLVKQIYMVAVRRLFSEDCAEGDVLKRLRVALALSMALPPHVLRLSDVVDVGEVISRQYESIAFRASPDGAARWTIQIMLGRPVIVSVVQIDDQPDVSLVTLCLSLALVAFASEIFEDVLAKVAPPRSEVNVQVCSFSEADKLLPLEKVGLDADPESCAVTRAADVASDAGAPILVITSDTLTERWLPGVGSGKSGQLLFAKVLVEAVFHLQSGDVELESLYPKVAQLISKTIA